MNLRGIKASARTNAILATGLGVVIVLFFGAAVRYLWAITLDAAALDAAVLRSRRPSPPSGFDRHRLAVLTYIGFDGISTLSEEAHNPRRNILLATVLVCLFTGVVGLLQVYCRAARLAGLSSFPDVDTAFCTWPGAPADRGFSRSSISSLLVANVGSGTGAHLGAGRLLYGMGRDDAIPRRFFGAMNPRTHIPSNNIAARRRAHAGRRLHAQLSASAPSC